MNTITELVLLAVIIGALFGTQTNNKRRTEIIILITPTVVRDQQGLRDYTDDYSRRFRAMDPLPPPGKLRAVPAQPHR